jgi:putative transposase
VGRAYRLTPTEEQINILTGWCHTARAVYNLALAQRQLVWDGRRIGLSTSAQCRTLAQARKEIDWIASLPSAAGQDVLRSLNQAYQNWWNPEHPAARPTFKRRSSALSFSLPHDATDVRHVSRKWSEVWVPKMGWVRFRRHRPINGVVRGATFSYSPGGGWKVSFGVAAKPILAPPSNKGAVGVDFGVACSAYLSSEDAPRLMAPTLTKGEQQRLAGLERRKARQVTFAKRHNDGTYSNRMKKTNQEIARLRARQARRRNDFTHKLTCDLAKNHGLVGIEDLSVKNMTASAKGTVEEPGANVRAKAGLNREILNNAPFERSRQLTYKVRRHGAVLVKVSPRNTSRRCSNCGIIDAENRPGCGRMFACVACGHQDHADHNAARNIEAKAIAMAIAGAPKTAGPAGENPKGRSRNSTGRRKPSHGRETVGGSVKPIRSEQSGPMGRVA